ncbi:hypothetical protein Pint_24725 [Pistacia integerrima]|uniref:Uncharacterized protein n=1 Tax=Pistacia integerrima TaxID=434235 RepID=A0ACC0YD90_9ROSI|nr:hypothetical protein Pint_24725 [Pistacia integerrima]
MKTLFKSQELWDVVEQGITIDRASSDEEQRLNKKRDFNALFFIQQAVHESIFFKNSEEIHKRCLDDFANGVQRLLESNHDETSIFSS